MREIIITTQGMISLQELPFWPALQLPDTCVWLDIRGHGNCLVRILDSHSGQRITQYAVDLPCHEHIISLSSQLECDLEIVIQGKIDGVLEIRGFLHNHRVAFTGMGKCSVTVPKFVSEQGRFNQNFDTEVEKVLSQ